MLPARKQVRDPIAVNQCTVAFFYNVWVARKTAGNWVDGESWLTLPSPCEKLHIVKFDYCCSASHLIGQPLDCVPQTVSVCECEAPVRYVRAAQSESLC